MEIRPVVADDYPAIMELIAEFAEESLSEYGTYLDSEQLQKTYDLLWRTSFAAVVGGKVVGVIAGRIVEDICSKLPVYEEIVWYVQKSHRKYGILLMRRIEDWCHQQNIKRLTMSCMHNSQTDKLFSLYERLGFLPMETRFIKELD